MYVYVFINDSITTRNNTKRSKTNPIQVFLQMYIYMYQLYLIAIRFALLLIQHTYIVSRMAQSMQQSNMPRPCGPDSCGISVETLASECTIGNKQYAITNIRRPIVGHRAAEGHCKSTVNVKLYCYKSIIRCPFRPTEVQSSSYLPLFTNQCLNTLASV